MCAATVIASPAQTFKSLVSFDGTDGSEPFAAPVQGTDGNLYGTTPDGGTNQTGTVFKVTPTGTLTAIYSFCSYCADGSNPQAGLVLGTDGNFYGAAASGGIATSPCSSGDGCGTLFKITSKGTLTTLYQFCTVTNETTCLDGEGPRAGLVQGTDGNFYGTTPGGGAGIYAEGTVFKITPKGTLTTLYSFCAETNCTDGEEPMAGLVQATDGNFYGTTTRGGANFYGEVFKISPSGKLTILHSFDLTDGDGPASALVQGSDGNLYRTTSGGGSNDCLQSTCGTVFKISLDGTFTSLVSFDGTDGAFPEYSPLIQATDGNFYGTAGGGIDYGGVIYEITSSGVTALYNFCSSSCGADGYGTSSLIQATNGTLYGNTAGGGTSGDGTIFSLSVGLGPFVETVPSSGKVGKAVKILGNNLTGATSVTFNGTAATFKVVSSTEITTTVPSGATTGTVQVTTPGGTLTSNVSFRVP